jgi:hypothetical protein
VARLKGAKRQKNQLGAALRGAEISVTGKQSQVLQADHTIRLRPDAEQTQCTMRTHDLATDLASHNNLET